MSSAQRGTSHPGASSSASSSKLPQRTNRLLFRRHLAHLQLRLHPLLSVSSGDAHPAFPRSILQYHLLTERQLDELAHWYHQRTPGPHSFSYPAPVIVRWDRAAPLEHKRRRFGRFIGLRGCESPTTTTATKPDTVTAATAAASSSSSSPSSSSATQGAGNAGDAAAFDIDGYRARVEAQTRELKNRFECLQSTAGDGADSSRYDTAMDVDMELQDVQSQEEMDRVIEARFRRALEREREREVWRRKGF